MSLDQAKPEIQAKRVRVGKWWKVVHRDSTGNRMVEVFKFAGQAERRQNDLRGVGTNSSIHRCRFDIVIVDPISKSMILINKRMLRDAAIQWASDWTIANLSSGVMIWPSGVSLPMGFEFVDESGCSSDSQTGVAS